MPIAVPASALEVPVGSFGWSRESNKATAGVWSFPSYPSAAQPNGLAKFTFRLASLLLQHHFVAPAS
jgi:hypothetical protein